MSALSTPGGGGTTAQNKPTAGKQKYQKLDINSLYCVNRNESSEPSSVKSQLSRKHGMQSLGKVPSARRPPANLPSLKTETGQDSITNSISAATTTVSTPPTCTSQTISTSLSSGVSVGGSGGGWGALPPPSSSHFRNEFPSLEAAAQPSHRTAEHPTPQTQLRPQTEGSWTSGGGVGGAREAAVPTPAQSPALQQTPALRAILPPFLMKGTSVGAVGGSSPVTAAGSGGGGLGGGVAGLGAARERAQAQAPRAPPRPAPQPRAVEVLTARPILRDDQISSLDDMSRDAGWAQNDDIDYDQKLDFSDGETSAPNRGAGKNNNRLAENERPESKIQEPGDEEQLWAERRQKQSNEVAQAVARARQRKEEEQRRQLRDGPNKDFRDKHDRDRNDNREPETREKDRVDNKERDRAETRDRDRVDNREKERTDVRERETRDKERTENRDRDRNENRYDNRDRDRDSRDQERDRSDRDNRGRNDNRDRPDGDKERTDGRDRDRNDNRERTERDRFDRDRQERDRDRDRGDRDRNDRDRERDRDFRDNRDYGRDREQNNPGYSKTFQENIPPRFLKLQQNRQQDDHKAWAFTAKSAPRRQEQQSYNAPRHGPHNGRRSYSRDFSDREDDFRRGDKEGGAHQWRTDMHEYDRPGRDLDRSNSKDSYKDNEFKDKRSEHDRKPNESPSETSGRSAADKLTEVFERKSIGAVEAVSTQDSQNTVQPSERKNTPPLSNAALKRESSEKDITKTSWAEVTQEDNTALKPPTDKVPIIETSSKKDSNQPEMLVSKQTTQPVSIQNTNQQTTVSISNLTTATQIHKINHIQNPQNLGQNQHTNNQAPTVPSVNQPQNNFIESQSVSKFVTPVVNPNMSEQMIQPSLPTQKTHSSNEQNIVKPIFAAEKSEKDLSESESVASKSSTDPSSVAAIKSNEAYSVESLNTESQKRIGEDKKTERFSNEQLNKIPSKESIERKSSGSGSEKKNRGGYGGGYAVYNRGWGPREARGRRSHRNSRSNNRASESDGSTDGTHGGERKDRRRAPRSPRGPKKPDRPDEGLNSAALESAPPPTDAVENREPFAPRGQPSRRGRGGFQGASRPPAPAKRVAGYGPPNTKSPFSQVNRAVKDNEEVKENFPAEDKAKGNNKSRTGSAGGRGRDRRPKGSVGPLSGEDENWETTSEHSEGGVGRRRSGAGAQTTPPHRGQPGRNSGQRQNTARNSQAGKATSGDNKSTEITEAMTDLKVSPIKKDEEEVVDDGFQEVRNKKNTKDGKPKDDIQTSGKQSRSSSNHGSGRNGSSSRNPNDKSNSRNAATTPVKQNPQYDRPRQANLAPRFVKQRQKQQLGLVASFAPDTGAAPPPPPVNAWDKPISQTLRGNAEETVEPTDIKSAQSSQRSTPAEAVPVEPKPAVTTSIVVTDKSGVLDGSTPPVETIIFENTNYKNTPSDEALQQKFQMNSTATPVPKPQAEEVNTEIDNHPLPFNGDVRARPRSIQEIIADNGRTGGEGDVSLGLQMTFDTTQKAEDSSDMKLDFAFDSDLGQLTEDKSAKALVLPRGVHMSTSNTISPLAADLNLKIASVKKVWEMPAVAEGGEELQFAGFEESNVETGAPPNVCKVKPTQQLQSPPPQHYNHVGYQGGYGGLSVSSPPAAVLFNSSQQLLGSSQQLPQQGGLYGAFLDQGRGQFGGFPPTPYAAGSAGPYNYQPPPDMFQSLPNQYRMAAGGGAAFGQTGQMANSPSTVLISSNSNSLMSASVKPSSQQIGAIGSKGGGVGGVGGVNTYQQQYLGYSAPVGETAYSLQGLLPRPAPPANSYYSPYQPPAAPAPTYPLQFTQPAQSGAFGSQFLSSPLQVAAAAAVQQMQQQYRGPMQQQYAAPQPRPPPQQQQQLKSPLHEHANGFSPLCEAASPTPKGATKPQKPPHSPPQHKYHAPPPHPPPALTPHQHHQQQQLMGGGGNGGRCGAGAGAPMARGNMGAPRYPAPIQRPHAPAMPMYRAPPTAQAPQPQPQSQPQQRPVAPHGQQPRANLYYHHHQRNGGGGGGDRATDGSDPAGVGEGGAAAAAEPAPASGPGAADAKPE